MNLKQIPSHARPFRAASAPPGAPPQRASRARLWERALTRRRFLHAAVGATGLTLGAGFLSPALADGCPDPKPIPGGLDFLGTGEIFHVTAPGYPGSGLDPATNDPSVITDFNGQVGLAFVRGTGTHTDLATGTVSQLPFEVDLRFMQGEYVGADGKHHQGTFGLVYFDVFDQSGQIHDFNPGIEDSGLFWVSCIAAHSVDVNPGSGRATMDVRDLDLEDYHDFVNSLLDGPSLEGIASFHIEWSASRDKHRFHDPGNAFDASMVLNSAKCAWAGRTEAAAYVSDPASTSISLFAEVGHERNGVFFR